MRKFRVSEVRLDGMKNQKKKMRVDMMVNYNMIFDLPFMML